jgi:hypothetical protein
MGMVVALAYFAVARTGGLTRSNEVRALDAAAAPDRGSPSSRPPTRRGCRRSRCSFISASAGGRAGIRARAGGGGYVAQRIFSATDRARRAVRHAVVQHRALRSAAVAVDPHCARVAGAVSRSRGQRIGLRPDADDPAVFPPVLARHHAGAFAAAYMSTIGTQLNWGASYVVNDFYRRFLRRHSPEREYVVVSQLVTVSLMLVSIYVTLHLARSNRRGSC